MAGGGRGPSCCRGAPRICARWAGATPAYGHLIALGVLDAVQQRNVSPERIAHAADYRALIARTGRFLTFSAGAATLGYRLRADPRERAALRIVRETDGGVVAAGQSVSER